MSNILKSVIFGVIEGVTEWLPVSSTGHLIIAESLVPFTGLSDGFYEAYSVIIQLGAVLSVAMLFFKRMFPFSQQTDGKIIDRNILKFDFKIAVGCVPAAVAGFFLDDWIDENFYSRKTVALSLIIYGILFIIVERAKKNSVPAVASAEDISFPTAIKVGLFQSLSLIPGTSRSGSTVMGGMLCGMSRYAAAEFSFFMAVPIMAGASAVKAADFGFRFSFEEAVVLFVGFVTAFVVSVFTVDRLMNFVKNKTFTAFGIYRIILGAVLIIFDFQR